jgi:hypothetical protein
VIRVLRHSRGLALFALLVMAGSVPVSMAALLHDGADDTCQPRLVLHDHSAHRIGASRGSATPDNPHCVVCHWLQSVQTVVSASGAAPPLVDSQHLAVSVLPRAGAAALEQIAARAPPAIV